MGIDVMLIITSTTYELYGNTNIDDLKRPWTPKQRILVIFSRFSVAAQFKSDLHWNDWKQTNTACVWNF